MIKKYMSKKYIIRRDGKYLEFTEQEVRELASQLAKDDTAYEEIKLMADDVIVGEVKRRGLDFITDEKKVSSCCGAEIVNSFKSKYPTTTCKSCGEPCEAVSEELKWQPGQKHEQALKLKDYIDKQLRDTKPDPLYPGFTKEELISRVNWLLSNYD